MSSFNELLQAGEIDSAIQLRLDTLENTARGYRTDCESAKLGSALVTVLGLGMSANPLIGFIAVLGSVGYGYTVLKDYRLTGRFCPLPGIRKGASQLFEAVAGAADNQNDADDPLLDVMGFLPPESAHEYELLSVSDGAICRMLGALPPAKRAAGYSFLLRRTRLMNSLHLPSLADTKDAIALLNESSNTPELQDSPIGANTRLGAIDVPALSQNSTIPTDVAEDRWWESKPADTVTAIKSAHPVDHLIGDRLRTSLIVSVSGGGKDVLLSNALRSFLSTHPGFKVIVMDCKDDLKETGYYANLPNVRLHRMNVAIASDGEVVQWVDRCIDEFLKLPERALLINNEGTLIRAKSKRYVAAIDGLVSSGDSREKYAWEAGQSAHIDDLKINGAARSRFRLIIIGLLGEQLQVDAVLKAQCVADAAKKPEIIEAEMRRSPVQRAWCDGLQWYPMPVLENYSGYNRDARSFVGGNPAPQVSTKDTKANLEKLYQVDAVEAPTESGEPIEKLSRYLQSKGKIDFRTLSKNWGRNHNLQDEQLKDLVTQLEQQGLVMTWGDGILWKG